MNKTVILLLTMIMPLLSACTDIRQPISTSEGAPVLTANPVGTLSSTDKASIARRLAQRVEDSLTSFDLPRDICSSWRRTGNGSDRIAAYNRAVRDAFGRLFSSPDAKLFDVKELRTIFADGTRHMGWPVALQLAESQGGVALVAWEGAQCSIGARPTSSKSLYLFDAQGKAWDLGHFNLIEQAHPTPNGWVILAADTGHESGPNAIWHLRRVGDQWETNILFGMQGGYGLALSFHEDYHRLHVSYTGTVAYDPPCHFRPAIAFHHALHTEGEADFEWRNDSYIPVDDRYTVEVYVDGGGVLLQNWQAYCEN